MAVVPTIPGASPPIAARARQPALKAEAVAESAVDTAVDRDALEGIAVLILE